MGAMSNIKCKIASMFKIQHCFVLEDFGTMNALQVRLCMYCNVTVMLRRGVFVGLSTLSVGQALGTTCVFMTMNVS